VATVCPRLFPRALEGVIVVRAKDLGAIADPCNAAHSIRQFFNRNLPAPGG
jgi:hypothetical protein